MKISEILTEGVLLERTSRSYYKPGYHASEGRKHLSGDIRDWHDQAGIKPEHISAAVKQVKETEAFKNLLKSGFKYAGTRRTEANGTLRFKHSANGREYQIMGNGQIRVENHGERATPLKHRTKLNSPKPRQVPGDPVKTLVRTHEEAMKALAKKKLKEDLSETIAYPTDFVLVDHGEIVGGPYPTKAAAESGKKTKGYGNVKPIRSISDDAALINAGITLSHKARPTNEELEEAQRGHLKEDDVCPQCKKGHLEQRSHRFSTDRGPNVPDADWLECDNCDFKTDPE